MVRSMIEKIKDALITTAAAIFVYGSVIYGWAYLVIRFYNEGW